MKYQLITFLLFTCSVGYAQIPFGFKAGVNLSDVYYKDVPENSREALKTEMLFSFHAGVSAKIAITDKLLLIPDVHYIQKGFKSGDTRFKYNYIELPFVASYKLASLLSVEAGPSLGVNISSSVPIKVNTFDVGLLGGLRFHVNDRFDVVSRYCYGISIIDELEYNAGPMPGGSIGTVKGYSRSIQFSVLYYLN